MKLNKWRLGVIVLVMVILTGVVSGCFDQKQADKVPSQANREAGGGYAPPNGPPNSYFNGEGPERPGYNLNDAASLLNMTTDNIKSEMQSGKTIEQIVTEHGMTMEQFDEKMLAKRKADIAQAVADGKMTQEQADRMLQNMGKQPDGGGPRQR
ncbi:hypothetical protein [Pelotomaculum sp. PtaB.Bin117]|uniref:hypothetical protein n=1 Tax=Pelotomaculum sp. PtaB.Bin117 TaxID=1811694 RepID=UPI0009D0DD99|nr:hypothetical protein [Pelotomaculum sp. PtaB.Bin117]OPX90151.1 MAG: hypothetical protein A4E54_00725 [Pelotomaculum sp. PtaB.Bin117]